MFRRLFGQGWHWGTTGILCVLAIAAGCFAMSQLSTMAFADNKPLQDDVVSAQTFIIECGRNAASEPETFSVLCGSGTYVLKNLHWQSWGSEEADAVGTYFEKDCVPNCAQGMLQGYPVRVQADGIQQSGTVSRYKRLTLNFAGVAPKWLGPDKRISVALDSLDSNSVRKND